MNCKVIIGSDELINISVYRIASELDLSLYGIDLTSTSTYDLRGVLSLLLCLFLFLLVVSSVCRSYLLFATDSGNSQ